MKTPVRNLVPFAAALLAVSLLGEPAMPDGFVASWTDSSGLTWRETGILPLPLDEAIMALKATMKEQGYILRHDITGDAFGDLHLFLWLKEGEEATIMAWPDSGNATSLCWGVTDANASTNTMEKASKNEKDD